MALPRRLGVVFTALATGILVASTGGTALAYTQPVTHASTTSVKQAERQTDDRGESPASLNPEQHEILKEWESSHLLASTFNEADGTITWTIAIASPRGGMPQGTTFTVIADTGAGHEIVPSETSASFSTWTHPSGTPLPSKFVRAKDAAISTGGSVLSLENELSRVYYQVAFTTRVTDPAVAEYDLDATVYVEGSKAEPVLATMVHWDGSR